MTLDKKLVGCGEIMREMADTDGFGRRRCPISQRDGVVDIECPYVRKEGMDSYPLFYCKNTISENPGRITLYKR